MFKKIKKIISYPFYLKMLMIRAFFFSMFFEIWLSTNNFEKIKSLHSLTDETADIKYTDEEILKIQYVTKTINVIKKYAPWKPVCYNLALTSRKLLKREDIPCELKIGFKKGKKSMEDIEGHAWVKCNTWVVSGYLVDLKSYHILKPMKK